MTRPLGILLDLDDTILDDSGSVDACWQEAIAAAEPSLPHLAAEQMNTAIREYANWWWSDSERARQGRLDLRTATAAIVTEALGRLDCDDRNSAAMIANRYRDLREERVLLHEGALETVQWLRSEGIKLGLMTNGAGPPQRAKLERFQLANHFEHIIIEGEFGAGKPDPRVYRTLIEALGVPAEQTWAVGDNIEVDVRGAMRQGMRGVWVNPDAREAPPGPDPDHVISSLSEIRSLFF
jgi:putative hydrolase of the HAD superfamily